MPCLAGTALIASGLYPTGDLGITYQPRFGRPYDSSRPESALATHFCCHGCLACRMRQAKHPWLARLISLRRQVGQRRVQPLSVVNCLDERPDQGLRLRQIAICSPVHLFTLQGPHPALRHRVVPRTTCPAHAGLNARLLQSFDVIPTGILGGFKRSSQHDLCWPIGRHR